MSSQRRRSSENQWNKILEPQRNLENFAFGALTSQSLVSSKSCSANSFLIVNVNAAMAQLRWDGAVGLFAGAKH